MKDQKLMNLTKQETIDMINHIFIDSLSDELTATIERLIEALGVFFNSPLYLYESIQPSLTFYQVTPFDISIAHEQLLKLTNQHNVSLPFIPITSSEEVIGFIFIDSTSVDIELIERVTKLISYRLIGLKNTIELNETKKQNQILVQTKQHFLSNMSHEIKTPLSGIYSSLYLLGSTDLSQEQKEFYQMGHQSLDKLSSIIDDMLELSHLDSGKLNIYKDTFNLEEEMIRLYRVLKNSADEKGLDFQFLYDYQKSFECIGDFRKIRQIFHNLIDNAIKFTNHGTITFSVSFEENDNQTYILCLVKDTGIGISQADLSNLFDLFYQIDQEDTKTYEGVGIGLTIASKLINALSGSIEVHSELGKGSEFVVKIPIDKGNEFEFPIIKDAQLLLLDQHTFHMYGQMFSSMGMQVFTENMITDQKFDYLVFGEKEVTKQKMSQWMKKYVYPQTMTIYFQKTDRKPMIDTDFIFDWPISRDSIYKRFSIKKNQLQYDELYDNFIHAYALIVDDNRLNRVALSNTLAKIGMESKQADSGKQAIEFVKKENFDCILMDIQMPEMDGIEATRRIRSLGKAYETIPIIAVTANAFLKDYDVLKTSKITDVIFKPIHVDHLKQVLRKHIKPKSTIQIPSELEIFDQTDFKNRFEGSYDIGNEVVRTFLQECPKDMKRIEEAIQEKNLKKIEHEAHYFKGSCSYLSAKRLVWILSLMVESAKKNNLKIVLSLHNHLLNEMDLFIESIKEYRL